MPDPTPTNKQRDRVRSMFGSIARRYDFLNHLLCANVDVLWRRHAAREALDGLPWGSRVLDAACGTGDMALALRRYAPGAAIVGLDFTHEMLAIAGGKQAPYRQVRWVEGDGLRMPFEDATFNLVTIAFGLRNFEDLDAGLAELRRVLKPGGRLAVLEFTQPEPEALRGAFHFMFRRGLPAVAGVFSRAGPYRYLAESIEAWPDRRSLARTIRQAGFRPVRHQLLHFRVAALHMGTKE